MVRPRLVFQADAENRIAVIKYIGAIYGDRIVPEAMAHFRAVDRIWDYDGIFDLRRHEGFLEAHHCEDFGRQWQNLAGGRDAGRRTAVISTDPLVHARFTTIQTVFPFRTMTLFDTLEAAEAWIREGQLEGQTGPAAA